MVKETYHLVKISSADVKDTPTDEDGSVGEAGQDPGSSRCIALLFFVMIAGGSTIAAVKHFATKSNDIVVLGKEHPSNGNVLRCRTATIDELPTLATPLIPPGFKLLQATIHQRHMDRWMYRHDYIHNYCWTDQINSTHPTMQKQCDYDLSSVWQKFNFTSDPYAKPARGSCEAKQLTVQGQTYAEELGVTYRELLFPDRIEELCETGMVHLECDDPQKNQITTQYVYRGLCGHDPDVGEYPRDTVVDDGTVKPGRPFYLRTSICNSDFLRNAMEEATDAFLRSEYTAQMKTTAAKLAEYTGKNPPEDEAHLATFLDNVFDCVVSHACHDLSDVPEAIWTIFEDVDMLETESRLYPFDYFLERSRTSGDSTNYTRFVANYYGYYFVTVLDRMQRAINYFREGANEATGRTEDMISGDSSSSDPPPPILYLQVTSDSIISPQLKLLGAPRWAVERRPVWGSQIIYQLLEREGAFYVSTTFEGKPVKGELDRIQPWEDFVAFVNSITPSSHDCSRFFDNYILY